MQTFLKSVDKFSNISLVLLLPDDTTKDLKNSESFSLSNGFGKM